MQLNLEIGKLYQVNYNYDLVPTPSWEFTTHELSLSYHRKNTLIIPLEIQTENGNEDIVAIKVLTQNGITGWFLTYKSILHKYLTLVNAQ